MTFSSKRDAPLGKQQHTIPKVPPRVLCGRIADQGSVRAHAHGREALSVTSFLRWLTLQFLPQTKTKEGPSLI